MSIIDEMISKNLMEIKQLEHRKMMRDRQEKIAREKLAQRRIFLEPVSHVCLFLLAYSALMNHSKNCQGSISMIALAGITQSIKEGVKMKPIHFHISYCKRSAGRSVIEYASYCSGESLLSQYNGVRYYKERDDVVYKEILLPPNAPDDYQNREILWNSVELYEDKNAQLARLIDVALPNEINREDQIILIRDYVQQVFVAEGMCADVAVHDKGTGNPHAHIILTLRSLDENGN